MLFSHHVGSIYPVYISYPVSYIPVYIISRISHFTFRFTIHFTTNHYQKRSMSGLLCRPCNSKTQHFLQATIFIYF